MEVRENSTIPEYNRHARRRRTDSSEEVIDRSIDRSHKGSSESDLWFKICPTRREESYGYYIGDDVGALLGTGLWEKVRGYEAISFPPADVIYQSAWYAWTTCSVSCNECFDNDGIFFWCSFRPVFLDQVTEHHLRELRLAPLRHRSTPSTRHPRPH